MAQAAIQLSPEALLEAASAEPSFVSDLADRIAAICLPEQPEPTVLARRDATIALYDAAGRLRSLRDIEGEVIRRAMDHCSGRISEVARRLGIGRTTLYRKLDEFGIDVTGAASPR